MGAQGARDRRAVPQTALIPIVIRRLSSGLLNFATHPPDDRQRDREFGSVAPPMDRAEAIVPMGTGRRAFPWTAPVAQRHTDLRSRTG